MSPRKCCNLAGNVSNSVNTFRKRLQCVCVTGKPKLSPGDIINLPSGVSENNTKIHEKQSNPSLAAQRYHKMLVFHKCLLGDVPSEVL